MINPKIEEEWPIKPVESLEGVKDFDIAKYLNDKHLLIRWRSYQSNHRN